MDDIVSSYGKVWNYADTTVHSQFEGIVEIEEKIDGSQFSAMRDENGSLRCRSKGCEVHNGDAGMFTAAVRTANSIPLHDGWIYRFEYLSKPKHNTLRYSRVPLRHLMLFEVERPGYDILPHAEMAAEAVRLGIECVPLLHRGPILSMDAISEMLDRESILGGEKIEGVVIKARTLRHAQDGKVLKAKVVSSDFKERHNKEWKKANPSARDIKTELGECLCTEARFRKAVQALAEAGELEGSVRDIGKLMAHLGRDLHAEQAEWVKEQLFKWAWPHIQRVANRGFPDWYKAHLATAVPEQVAEAATA